MAVGQPLSLNPARWALAVAHLRQKRKLAVDRRVLLTVTVVLAMPTAAAHCRPSERYLPEASAKESLQWNRSRVLVLRKSGPLVASTEGRASEN